MGKKKQKPFVSRILRILVRIILGLFLITLFQVFSLRYIDPWFTPNVVWEWGESIIQKKPGSRPDYRFVSLDKISPHLQRAVIASEDQRFLNHHGFDFSEIRNSIRQFYSTGRLRGASTISMQAARSVFLLSSRRFYRKIAEAYYTGLIELAWDKQRIFEIYLNTVDWGTGITGAEAAAWKYFNRPAKQLTRSQAAWMAAILPNPHRWSIQNPTPYLKSRQKKILKMMSEQTLPDRVSPQAD